MSAMRVHALRSAPDSWSDFRPIGSEALSVFAPDAIATELRAMRKHMDLPADPAEPGEDLEDVEWFEAVMSMVASLGPTLESDACAAWAREAEDRIRMEVAIRIRSALRAVQYASRAVDPDGSSATGLLLPTSFARRAEALLDTATLPIAWVRRLDLLRF